MELGKLGKHSDGYHKNRCVDKNKTKQTKTKKWVCNHQQQFQHGPAPLTVKGTSRERNHCLLIFLCTTSWNEGGKRLLESGSSYREIAAQNSFEVGFNSAYLVEASMEDLLHRVTIK